MRFMLMLISGLKDMALGNCCDTNTSRTVVTNALLSDAVLVVEEEGLWICIVLYSDWPGAYITNGNCSMIYVVMVKSNQSDTGS
jgi:hypothetical protein